MWKVLIPIILLVIVLLFQLQVRETFVTTAIGTDASGNPTDASGNPITKTASSTITLTLSDLLSLFKATAGTTTPAATTTGGGTTSTMFYSTTSTTADPLSTSSSSSLGKSGNASAGSTVDGVSSSNLSGSPYVPSQPIPIPSEAPCSDAAAQGVEFQNALQDYIKKDEIPCYGCTL